MKYDHFLNFGFLVGILLVTYVQNSGAMEDFVAEAPNDANSSKEDDKQGNGTSGSNSENEYEGLVVGGRNANDGEFPYQVSLRTPQGSHFCGGSIISANYILTAAHCVPGLGPSDLIVVVGSNYLNSGGLGYRVSQITSHGAYNPQTNFNDIAVLRIDGNIQFSEKVKSIALGTVPPPSGTKAWLSGWGLTSYPSSALPNALQCIELKTISLVECVTKLPGYPIAVGHVCTYMPAGQGGCKGDSGGPLVANSSQIGIVSWGIPCAKGNPDVFTSVSFYRSWIRQTTGV